MKTTHNGKRYDSDKCETLAEREHYSYSNNYSGTTSIERATDGTLLILTRSNGQDIYMQDAFYVPEEDVCFDSYDMTDAQETRCAELGLIEIVK